MKQRRQGSVLILDDEPDAVSRSLEKLLKRSGLKAEAIHPENLTRDAIKGADLVLVDYYLQYWEERGRVGVGLQPRDGLALATIVRRNVAEDWSPTAIAIITSKLHELMSPLPPENRAHIVSRLNGLEWIFNKSSATKELVDQIASLVEAVRSLPDSWIEDKIDDSLIELLKIPRNNERLGDDLLHDALRCHPPVHEMSEWSHGLAFIRWLLQRVMPYPCFLIDRYQLAARLRVDSAALKQEIRKPKSALAKALQRYEYKGILAGFLGVRWWRVGIEAFLWAETSGRPFDPGSVHEAISQVTGSKLTPSTPDVDPIVCYADNFLPLDRFGSVDSAVRIWPDDWPEYAEQPWVHIEAARDDRRLGALVIEEDRERLKT